MTAKRSAGARPGDRGKRVALKQKGTAPPAAPSVAAQLPAATPAQLSSAQAKFEAGIVARGEAAPAGRPLPPGATHEIAGYKADKAPILKRKRFSLR